MTPRGLPCCEVCHKSFGILSDRLAKCSNFRSISTASQSNVNDVLASSAGFRPDVSWCDTVDETAAAICVTSALRFCSDAPSSASDLGEPSIPTPGVFRELIHLNLVPARVRQERLQILKCAAHVVKCQCSRLQDRLLCGCCTTSGHVVHWEIFVLDSLATTHTFHAVKCAIVLVVAKDMFDGAHEPAAVHFIPAINL